MKSNQMSKFKDYLFVILMSDFLIRRKLDELVWNFDLTTLAFVRININW